VFQIQNEQQIVGVGTVGIEKWRKKYSISGLITKTSSFNSKSYLTKSILYKQINLFITRTHSVTFTQHFAAPLHCVGEHPSPNKYRKCFDLENC